MSSYLRLFLELKFSHKQTISKHHKGEIIMKLLSNLRNRLRKNLIKNEDGQGATEYILLLVVVVVIVMMFKDKIKGTMTSKMGELDKNISDVKVDSP
jgi:Flp pilus assembly pilin Flp